MPRRTISKEDTIDIIEQALELFGQAAEMLRGLGDEYIRRTVVAELEGREGGWIGRTSADILRDRLRELEDGEDEDEDEEAEAKVRP